MSNFPRGRDGLYSCKGSGSVYQKWSLASPTDQKNTVEMQEDFLRKFVVVFVTYRHKWRSLKILDNISVIISTKVRKNMIPIHLLSFHPLQALGAAKGFINLITK